MFAGPLIEIKLHLLSTVSVDFRAPRLWNPVSKIVPGKLHGSGGRSNWNCLQDLANFYRFRARQIVLNFNTGLKPNRAA